MLAIEESVSIGWARVVRGMASVEKALMRRCARARTASRFRSGMRDPTRNVPGRIQWISSRPAAPTAGAFTLSTMSAEPSIAAGSGSTVAPASR